MARNFNDSVLIEDKIVSIHIYLGNCGGDQPPEKRRIKSEISKKKGQRSPRSIRKYMLSFLCKIVWISMIPLCKGLSFSFVTFLYYITGAMDNYHEILDGIERNIEEHRTLALKLIQEHKSYTSVLRTVSKSLMEEENVSDDNKLLFSLFIHFLSHF